MAVEGSRRVDDRPVDAQAGGVRVDGPRVDEFQEADPQLAVWQRAGGRQSVAWQREAWQQAASQQRAAWRREDARCPVSLDLPLLPAAPEVDPRLAAKVVCSLKE